MNRVGVIRFIGERQQVKRQCGDRQCQSSQGGRILGQPPRPNGNPASADASGEKRAAGVHN
jgi:hypothetical protein